MGIITPGDSLIHIQVLGEMFKFMTFLGDKKKFSKRNLLSFYQTGTMLQTDRKLIKDFSHQECLHVYTLSI